MIEKQTKKAVTNKNSIKRTNRPGEKRWRAVGSQ